MQKLNKQKRPTMQYQVMDALHMTFEDNMFSTVFDKGTLDALVSDDSPESLERAELLFKEINRITKSNGRYICISLLQEHIIRKILSYFYNGEWQIRIKRCNDVEKKAVEKGEAGMPVFAVICTKSSKKSVICLI